MGTLYGERWERQNSLSESGQSRTFLAKDTKGSGETSYVLKLLKNPGRIERFKKETEATRKLSHENIVTLLDFDLEGKEPYLVTEYCQFGSLSRCEPFWKGNPRKTLELFEQICNGVGYAHQHGVVHRDLKPDNIFLRGKEGPAVVGDFGLCFIDEGGSRITLTEEAVGSRYYMAPELENGAAEVTDKCDVYSLGKILYWMFRGDIFSRETHREPRWDLKGRNSESSFGWSNIYMEHVNRLLDRMIVVDPNARANLNEVLNDLPLLTRLLEGKFNPIDRNIKMPCTYCGYGYYLLQASSVTQVENFGFRVVGTANWRILTCNVCGHVQAFRVDMAQRKDWWG